VTLIEARKLTEDARRAARDGKDAMVSSSGNIVATG
jgi:hypothetical protein